MYLVDTSVWIDFLRGSSNPHVVLLETLLDNGDAFICEVVYAEICFGARDEFQLRKYIKRFGNLPFLPLPEKWHEKAAKIGFELRRKGFKPFVGDLLIVLVALTHQIPLLTRDKDFKPYQQFFSLRLE